MKHWYQGLFVVFSMLPLIGFSESESLTVPVVYGDQNIERVASDLQRLEKFVYRTLGPDRLNHPTTTSPSNDTEAPSQLQVELFQSRLDTLSQELPALVGRVEELEYQNQKLVESIAFLKQEMEKAAAAKEAAPPPTVQTGSEPSADPKPEVDDYATLSVEDLEKKAKASLVAAQYDEARLLFERLLTKDLSVEQEISARFYLGEIWFLKKQHGKASDYYLKAYQKDPKGPKAPKSLLKVALSLQSLGKKKEACITLKKLLKDHPKAESTVLAMAKEKKAECCGA